MSSKKQAIDFKDAIPRTKSDIYDILNGPQLEKVEPPNEDLKPKMEEDLSGKVMEDDTPSPTFLYQFNVSATLLCILRNPELEGSRIAREQLNKIESVLGCIRAKHQLSIEDEECVLFVHQVLSQIDNIQNFHTLAHQTMKYPDISNAHHSFNSINAECILHRIRAMRLQKNEGNIGKNTEIDPQYIDLTISVCPEFDVIHFAKNTLSISKQYITQAYNSHGYLEPHFAAFFINKFLEGAELRYFIHNKKHINQEINQKVSKQYPKIIAQMLESRVQSYEQWYIVQVQSLIKGTFSIQDLKSKIVNRQRNVWIEKFLVGLLGWDEKMATEATILLNAYYDGVDWQIFAPFNPIISQVGEKFQINYLIDPKQNLKEKFTEKTKESQKQSAKQNTKQKQNEYHFSICLKAPCGDADYPGQIFSWHDPQIQYFKSDDDKYLSIHEAFGKFSKTGFYDWKLFKFDDDGRFHSVHKIVSNQKNIANKKKENEAENKKIHDVKPVQGRFIVHPENTRKMQIHEIYMDSLTIHDSLQKVPHFEDASDDIKKYANYGINCVYLMGVFQRDSGQFAQGFKRPNASPIALTSRKKPCSMLGGEAGFNKLMSQSKKLGMKVITDCTARISSTRYRKIYEPYLLSYIDESGKKFPFYGAQGRSINYEDTAILNYRKLDAWELLIEQVIEVAQKYEISGIYLDNGSSWPNIFQINKEEMFRTEDKEYIYSRDEIFEGKIVNKSKIGGYWLSDKQTEYPNPLFIKIMKTLWRKLKNFTVICESFQKIDKDEKNISAIISGVIPRTFKMPKAIAQVVGINLTENGYMTEVSPKNIVTFKKWYEEIQKYYPRNSIIIQSTSSHAWPYPAFLFKKLTWAFVDLIFFLPEIPMTFVGEHDGKAFRSKATSIFFENHQNKEPQSARNLMRKTNSSFFNATESNSSITRLNSSVNPTIRDPAQIRYLQENFRREVGPEFGFDLKEIHKHYAHRRKIRNQIPLLTSGKMMSLSAEHKYGIHKNVLSFAKYNDKEILLISINFNESNVDMHYNLNNLKYLFTKAYQSKLVVKVQSVLGGSEIEQTYFTVGEFILSRIEVTLKGYQSMIWKVTIDKQVNPEIAYQCSIKRMKKDLQAKPPKWIYSSIFTNQLSYLLDNCQSTKSFLKNLQYLYEKFIVPENINFSLAISKVHDFWLNKLKLSKIFGIFKLIDSFEEFNPTLKSTIKKMIDGNRLGPIAFVTPEIGEWSTVGGLGVMVDELTKELAKLGEQVYIVTPYYEYNKKGETGYLQKYGFHHKMNIKVQSAHLAHEIGIHTGNYKGVNFIWLHNPELFSKPYAGESAFYVTKQLVFFALATSESFCQLKVFPSIIVTNDWMCGFVGAYIKENKFGSVFNGTKLMHICHNLDPLYEGRLYPKHEEGDLGWLVQLRPELYIEYRSNKTVINPSKCALQTCDNWGTVSNSYKFDLLKESPLSYVLWKHSNPFSFPNGVRKEQRVGLLRTKTPFTHSQSKIELRNKYFKDSPTDSNIPILTFIGRITKQKGVHLILESVESILYEYNYKVQFIVGGPADVREEYGKYCADKMKYLNYKYPKCFWSDPHAFFYDGPLCNVGSDYALMPSLFEPGGIVQHQFFCGKTPVIAFRTGGLKDTVFEYDPTTQKGNGFNFMRYDLEDFKSCLRRAINIFKNDQENYKKMRENAFDSVVEEEDVAKGWNTEFYRLQNKIYIDWISVEKQIKALEEKDSDDIATTISPIGQNSEYWNEEWEIRRDFKNVLQSCQKLRAKEVTFIYETDKIPRPKEVLVSGTWDDWKGKKKMFFQQAKKNWKIEFKLQPGTYYYKYIEDNQWTLNKKEAIDTDIDNIENHVIVVE